MSDPTGGGDDWTDPQDGSGWTPQTGQGWDPQSGQGSQSWDPQGTGWSGQAGGQQWPPPPQPWGAQTPPGQRPSSMLPWSIAATLLCCLPLGIAGIVFSTRADNAFASGDVVDGMRNHQLARNFTIASAVVGPILIIGFLAVALFVGVASSVPY